MFPRRPLFRIALIIILGLMSALCIHAGQTYLTASNSSSSAPGITQLTGEQLGNLGQSANQSAPLLPPETKELLARIPGGLYSPPRGDVRVVVISDLNSAYGSTDYDPEVDKAISLLPFWRPDMVVCSGDMVAGQYPSLTEVQLQAMWSAFDSHVAAPLRKAKLPYGFTMGNHDSSSARSVTGKFLFARERNVAANYWNQPSHNPGVEFVDKFEFPFYYTFKYKDVFFLAWDGSSDFIPQDKLKWVERALQSPAAKKAKIKILLGHLPLYAITVGRNDPGEVMANTERLRAMLERNQVHTYISGHHHAYYPAHKGKLQLLHMGILGAGPRPYLNSRLAPRKSLTVMDIKFGTAELTTYTTYDMRTMQPIKYAELPRSITGHNGMVLRRDVELTDLSDSERDSCKKQLGAGLCSA
ncbi:MAG: metallophosphoesterase [Cyanobacteria bacterium WB6_1B_304]|jgi:Calcineurin-like phosphoesterase|nr:metallophosphoesterase [Cyanobacteria bacterium WB6_1B_304]